MNKTALPDYAAEIDALLKRFGVETSAYRDGTLTVRTPLTGTEIGRVRQVEPSAVVAVVGKADAAFEAWRKVPGPQRGELVRLFGEELRSAKTELGRLVTLEVGKIVSEGL